MKKQTGLEMECFVHGALCYCYSGQCLLSSMIGGRSGNRGTVCAAMSSALSDRRKETGGSYESERSCAQLTFYRN